MSRTNLFVKAGNEHRDVAIGGRGTCNSGYAVLNTDNGHFHDVSLAVRAEVVGKGITSKERRRTLSDARRRGDDDLVKRGGDDRESRFTVELPESEKLANGCQVVIETHDYQWRGLIQTGAMLAGLKAAQQMIEGEIEQAKVTLDTIKEVLYKIDTQDVTGFHNVVLPGGVTLSHALACVEIVKRLVEDGGSSN